MFCFRFGLLHCVPRGVSCAVNQNILTRNFRLLGENSGCQLRFITQFLSLIILLWILNPPFPTHFISDPSISNLFSILNTTPIHKQPFWLCKPVCIVHIAPHNMDVLGLLTDFFFGISYALCVSKNPPLKYPLQFCRPNNGTPPFFEEKKGRSITEERFIYGVTFSRIGGGTFLTQ